MRRQTVEKKVGKFVSIFLLVMLALGGITIDPLDLLQTKKNASGAPMTVFYENFDSSTGFLPWTGSTGTWTDRTNYPSGYGI
ncbi:MAG: hypothetical protein ACFFDT_22955, partial [Candidatus Hodarchaeota archaeon]